jgi:hypothetical protein
VRDHSLRRTVMGSVRIARRAGTCMASNVIAATNGIKARRSDSARRVPGGCSVVISNSMIRFPSV